MPGRSPAGLPGSGEPGIVRPGRGAHAPLRAVVHLCTRLDRLPVAVRPHDGFPDTVDTDPTGTGDSGLGFVQACPQADVGRPCRHMVGTGLGPRSRLMAFRPARGAVLHVPLMDRSGASFERPIEEAAHPSWSCCPGHFSLCHASYLCADRLTSAWSSPPSRLSSACRRALVAVIGRMLKGCQACCGPRGMLVSRAFMSSSPPVDGRVVTPEMDSILGVGPYRSSHQRIDGAPDDDRYPPYISDRCGPQWRPPQPVPGFADEPWEGVCADCLSASDGFDGRIGRQTFVSPGRGERGSDGSSAHSDGLLCNPSTRGCRFHLPVVL